jgi:hypothetical protein
MTKPDWAREKVEKLYEALGICHHTEWPEPTILLLRAERSRARRVVREMTRYRMESHGLTTQPDGKWLDRDELLRRLK